MRHLATIEKIVDVQPIENADAIEKVKVREWWCVAKKGEFDIGDSCVYFEIDSLLPSSNPAFEFLAKGNHEKTVVIEGKEYKGYRLKTIRLRGQLSQGLALPLSMFFGETSPYDPNSLEAEDALTSFLGIVKYEAPIPANLAGLVKGSFPSFLRKTDEERIQNCADILERRKGEKVYITEKLDGSSTTYYKKDGEFGVCSRNLELKDSEGNTQWTVAKQLGLIDKLPDGFSVQGEMIGEGIQGNPLKQVGHKFYAFNVFDIKEQKFLSENYLSEFLENYGIDMVPVLYWNVSLDYTVESILELANGNSVLCNEVPREGIVVRPMEEQEETINGAISRFSFKAISNKYLLDYES